MERNNLIKKGVVVSVILLFVSVSVIPSTGTVVERTSPVVFDGDTLYVGGSGEGNYTTIQDAIDNSSDGDTVYVYDDSSPYFENVIVNKSISLIGEDKNTTIIDGGGSRDVVSIDYYTDWVNISGFMIRNGSDDGIDINSDYNTVSGNNINSNNDSGIGIWFSSSNTIFDNDITLNNNDGLSLIESNNNIISSNNISNNEEDGILLQWCSYNSINGNKIKNNYDGIHLSYSSYNTISGNNISNNREDGITLWESGNNTIDGNKITTNNWSGINLYLDKTISNIITDNNIISNNNSGIYIGFFSNYNHIFGNNISNNGVVGLVLFGSDNNTITKNFITLNYEEGIYLCGSNSNNITRNTISENEDGIELLGSSNNIIKENNISSNYDYGIEAIMYTSYIKKFNSNMIMKNNFINNQQHAYFEGNNNIWRQNYWDRARIFPKFILGKIGILHKLIPWINFDWRPALKPYDIGV